MRGAPASKSRTGTPAVTLAEGSARGRSIPGMSFVEQAKRLQVASFHRGWSTGPSMR